jgi:hypothetical protein
MNAPRCLLWFGLVTGAISSCHAIEIECMSKDRAAVAYIVAPDLRLRPSPDAESSFNWSIELGQQVCAIGTSQAGWQSWIYVQTSYMEAPGRPYRGWLSRDSLAYLADFKPFESAPIGSVEVEIGDYFASYELAAKGQFRVWQAVGEHKCRKGEHPDEFGACNDYAYLKGRLFRNGSLVLPITTAGGHVLDVLQIKSRGCLCSAREYEEQDEYCLQLTPNPSVKGTSCGKPQAAPYVER